MSKSTGIIWVVALAMILAGYHPVALAHEVELSCPVAFGPAPDESGLIAYYPLDGNTADVTGNGMDAIEVKAVNPVEGKLGQGYHFNGKDSFIRLPLDISPDIYPQITVTAWIKPDDVKGARYVINQGDHGNRSLFVSHGAVSAGSAVVGNRRHTIYENRWVFVALTYDHATNTAVLLSDASITAAEATISEQPRPSVLIGAKAPGNSGFAGAIDEVRIYNRALTTTELAGLKKSPGSRLVEMDKTTPLLDEDRPEMDMQNTESDVQNAMADMQNAESDSQFATSDMQNAESLRDDLSSAGADSGARAYPQTDVFAPGVDGGQDASSNRAQLSEDQFGSVSAEDIPTGPDYQIADQDVDYVADGTMLMPEPTNDESSSTGSGEMRTTQQALTNENTLQYAPDESTRTAISGKSGSIIRHRMANRRGYVGFENIWTFERLDRLCRIDMGGDQQGSIAGISECGSEGGTVRSWEIADLGPSFRVAGVQVCTRARNDRVKGIRISGVALNSSGVGSTWVQDEISYPNCNGNWQTLVKCPSGKIAVGISGHFMSVDGRNRDVAALVGVQLYCRAVVAAN